MQAYHTALRNLGGAADEIEQLRTDLAERAEPAVAATRDGAGPGLRRRTASPPTTSPTRPTSTPAWRPPSSGAAPPASRASWRWRRPRSRTPPASWARSCSSSASTPASSTPASGRSSGPSLAPASARRPAPTLGRPRSIEAELATLQETARRLQRPEWATVSPSEADAPDIGELEERREKLLVRLDEVQPEIDVVRLADRQAALERRVMALEARHGGHDANGDPGAVADIQQHLLGRLTQAATAGPHGDPLPGRARRGVPPGARRAQVGSARPAPPPLGAPPADLPERRPLRRARGRARRPRDLSLLAPEPEPEPV